MANVVGIDALTALGGYIGLGGGNNDSSTPAAATQADANSQSAESAMAGVTPDMSAGQIDYDKIYELLQKNRTDYQAAWPESLQQGIQAGQTLDTASMAQSQVMNNWLASQTPYYSQFLQGQAANTNLWNMGQTAIGNQFQQGQIANANQFNSQQYYQAMNQAMPGLMGTVNNLNTSVDQMMSGQLPDSVKQQITQSSAERGLQGGLYGPTYNNMGLRDLGINQLQYQQAGQQAAMQLPGIAKQVMAPTLQAQPANASIQQNVQYTPSPYLPQQTNMAGQANNYMSGLMGASMMQPATIANVAAQNAQNTMAQSQFATQLGYSQNMSAMNYYQDQATQAWQQQMFQQQLAMQNQGQWLGLGESVIGGGAKVAGAAIASSSKTFKKDVVELTEDQQQKELDSLLATKVVTFRYKEEPDSRKKHIGVIAEESPEAMVTDDGKHINLGDAFGMLLAAVKTLSRQVAALKEGK